MTGDDRPTTKGDLIAMEERIGKTVKLTVKPVVEDVAGHRKTLYGDDGRGGLVNDVSGIKTTGRIVKWFAGIGGLSGLTAWVAQIWKDINH